MKLSFPATFFLGLASAQAAGSANAAGEINLIKNGSFEDTGMAPNTWRHFDASEIPGWMSLNNERIELWGTGLLGVKSQHGVNHLELDYHHGGKGDYLYQDVTTKKGQLYEASFYIRARRPDFAGEDETAIFGWNGVESTFTAEKAGVWTKVSAIVEGTGQDRFSIRESTEDGANNSYGPLIDNVKLVTYNTNLVFNGSFEETEVKAGTWKHFHPDQIPGWKSMNGERIELWGTGLGGVQSKHGVVHLELDYHHGSQIDYIYQDIQTMKGQMYEASFFIRARGTNYDSEDETAVFIWNGDETSFTAEKAGVWTKVSAMVEGTGGLDRLGIRESSADNASNSLGPLVDDVRLEPVDTNLLVNGSFEANKVPAKKWAHFDQKQIYGWKSLNGERIEIHGTGLLGVKSVDGVNHMELDYHSRQNLDHIYQDVKTEAGQKYEASFYMRARRSSYDSPDEAAIFSWNGAETEYTAEKKAEWTRISIVVVGTGGMDRFAIRESEKTGASNGLGPLIDDARLVAMNKNLLMNGSFDLTKVADKSWAHFHPDQIPGWKSLNGERIELWSADFLGVPAQHGPNFLELDYHHSSGKLDYIYQDVQTVKDQLYEVNFYIRARRANFDSPDETAIFVWNGDETAYTADKKSEWTKITIIVRGTGGMDRLGLRESEETGASNGLGPLIDNVSLVALDAKQAAMVTASPVQPPPTKAPAVSTDAPVASPSAAPSVGKENLVFNGSFEETEVPKGTWKHFSPDQVPGWKSLNGERIELWGTGMNGVVSQHGKNHLEIDYHHSSNIDYLYQDIQTVKDQEYEVSFYIRARRSNFDSEDETAVFIWNDQEASFTAEKKAVWTKISLIVIGTGGLDRIGIRESTVDGANNSYGPLIDNIRLETADDIPADVRSGMKVLEGVAPPSEAPVTAAPAPTEAPAADRPACGKKNLVVNGSFEETVLPAGTWNHFSADQVPGWKSLNGERIELWGTGMGRVESQHGVNHLEIDYHHSDKLDYIYQEIQTEANKEYEASFYIRARKSDFDSDSETAIFVWNDQETAFTAEKKKAWTKVSLTVKGSGGKDVLGIRESSAAGANTSYGPLIDNIRLVEAGDAVCADVRSTTKPSACLETVNPGAICVSPEVFLVEYSASPAQTCKKGEMVTVALTGTTKVDSRRNDLAWWVALDGGDALTGTCATSTLEAGVDFKFTNGAQVSFDEDICGDVVTDNGATTFEAALLGTREVPCLDDDEDGHLDVAICFSWNFLSTGACNPTAPKIGEPKDCNCKKYNFKEVVVEQPPSITTPC